MGVLHIYPPVYSLWLTQMFFWIFHDLQYGPKNAEDAKHCQGIEHLAGGVITNLGEGMCVCVMGPFSKNESKPKFPHFQAAH